MGGGGVVRGALEEVRREGGMEGRRGGRDGRKEGGGEKEEGSSL